MVKRHLPGLPGARGTAALLPREEQEVDLVMKEKPVFQEKLSLVETLPSASSPGQPAAPAPPAWVPSR